VASGHGTVPFTKAQKIRWRLGGTASVLEDFPGKPKGMWWRTYWRLREKAEQGDVDSLTGSLAYLRRNHG